jgi:hypothetical protein
MAPTKFFWKTGNCVETEKSYRIMIDTHLAGWHPAFNARRINYSPVSECWCDFVLPDAVVHSTGIPIRGRAGRVSLSALNYVWHESKHKGTELLVLLALADFADAEGKCWPSLPTIARKSRIDRRQVQRALRQLESSGEIIRLETGNGRFPSKYCVQLEGRYIVTSVTTTAPGAVPLSPQGRSHNRPNHHRTVNEPPKGKPSSLEEVTDFFDKHLDLEHESERFWNFYQSNGWKVGRNPMKDWKAAARGWKERRSPPNSEKPKEPAPRGAAYRVFDPNE